jgi:hypothetical protein
MENTIPQPRCIFLSNFVKNLTESCQTLDKYSRKKALEREYEGQEFPTKEIVTKE